jgi:hypothetical protein
MHLYLKGAFTSPNDRRGRVPLELVRALGASSFDTAIIRNGRCSRAYIKAHGGGGIQE